MGTVALLLGPLINAVLIAVIARRLLGAPVGWPRTLVIAISVSVLANPLLRWIVDRLALATDGGPGASAASVLVIAATIASLVAVEVGIMVVLEALVPSGSLPGPVDVARALPARWRRTKRYAVILRIAGRHGLARYLSPRASRGDSRPASATADSLGVALTEGGVTFVKLGQMLSTRPDLIGPEYAAALSRLHSEVAPQAWPKVQQTLEAELGGPIHEFFEHLEETPMAAASIAQIHRARLKNGDPVVVKVQRSDARRQVTADLDIVTRLARWLDRVTPWARNLGVRDLADGFAASLDEELDFRIEARNIQSIAVNATSVRVPTVHTSTRRVLVMEEMPGRPLSAAAVVGMSVERRRELADVLLNEILAQVLTFGVFHADLHAGNVLLDTSAAETNGLSLLDFGSVGRLDRGTRTSLGLLLLAVDRQDAAGATTALTDLLDGPVGVSGRALERDLGQVIMRHSVGSPAEEMFRDLYRLVLRHGLRIPPPMAAAFRSLASLDGTLMLLTPDRDLLGSAKAQGHKLLSKDLSPQGVRATLEDQLAGLVPILQRIPQQLSSVIDDVEAGRFTVTVRALQDEHERNFVTGLVQQAVISLLAATCALSGVLLVLDSSGPMMTPVLPLTTFSGTILLLIAFVLGSRVLVQTLRDSWSQRRN